MRKLITGAVALFLFAHASALQAQMPVTLEARGGGAFPTADFGDATLKAGGGFEFNAGLLLLPQVKIYGGWGWNQLVTDAPFRGANYDVESTGYLFGAQLQQQLHNGISGFVRAGGIYQHVELETRGGNLFADSGHELGWEGGGGLIIPVGGRFAVSPGVRYRTLSTELRIGSEAVPVDLSYVVVDLGLSVTLGSRPVFLAGGR